VPSTKRPKLKRCRSTWTARVFVLTQGDDEKLGEATLLVHNQDPGSFRYRHSTCPVSGRCQSLSALMACQPACRDSG
jgi:hypothetical protein